MTKFKNHFIACVPMRGGSKGFPGKNLKLMDDTLNYLHHIDMKYVISTDIKEILNSTSLAEKSISRPSNLASDEASIKSVLEHFCDQLDLDSKTWVWLFYVTFPYRDDVEFTALLKYCDALITADPNLTSIISFQTPRTHPYDVWSFDNHTGSVSRLFNGDWYRRQDKPIYWEHTHYLCGFRCDALADLNSELIGPKTHPVFLDEDLSRKLVEIDNEKDLRLAEFLWRS